MLTLGIPSTMRPENAALLERGEGRAGWGRVEACTPSSSASPARHALQRMGAECHHLPSPPKKKGALYTVHERERILPTPVKISLVLLEVPMIRPCAVAVGVDGCCGRRYVVVYARVRNQARMPPIRIIKGKSNPAHHVTRGWGRWGVEECALPDVCL